MYGFNSVTFVCFNFSLFLRVFRCDLIEDNYLEVFRFNNCQINKTFFGNILLFKQQINREIAITNSNTGSKLVRLVTCGIT